MERYLLLIGRISLVAQSCLTLCDPMDCGMPGFPVHHQLLDYYSNSCPSSWWCHPTISSSVVPFSSHLQSFPASRSFQMSQFIPSGRQSIRISASALPMNIQDWFPLGWTAAHPKLGSPCSSRNSQESSSTPQFKSINSSLLNFLYSPVLISNMTTGKTMTLTRWTFVGKVMSLLFYMLSRLVITFLLRSKHLLILWLQSPSAVILEPKKIKSATVSFVSPSICHEVMGRDAMILVFWMLNFKPAFSLSSFTFIKRLFSSSLLSAIRMVSSAYLRLLIFLPAILIPACVSSSPAFHIMFSAYKLNKQGDNIQPWCTPFPVWSQSVVPCPVLTVNASWPAYRFFRRQVRCSGIPISWIIFQFVVIYTVKGFGIQ